jgi:predicted transposase/invertase (TIGR01784 family)
LLPTIGIHFLDFEYFEDNRIVRQFVYKDVETNHAPEELNWLRLYFVEMGKFRKEWAEVYSALDRWVAFLNKAGELNRNDLPLQLQEEPAIIKAVAQLERIGLDPSERAIYEGEEKALMVNKSVIETAELRGEKRGRQEGRNEGRHEGKEEMLSMILEQRFSRLPDHITRLLDYLTSEQLDELGKAHLGFNSLTDLESWLRSI